MKIFMRFIAALCAVSLSAGALVSCGGLKEFDGDLRGRYDYDLTDYLKVGKYKGLEVYVGSDDVTKAEIDEAIYRNRAYYPATDWESVGEGVPAEKGNIVDVIYQGYYDGEPISGMKNSKDIGYSIMLGANMIFTGVDDEIIGMKIGDKKTFEIKVPEPQFDFPYYSGENITMEVELTDIRSAELAPYDDEFAENYGVATVEDFEAQTISDLRQRRQSKLESYVTARAMKQIEENFKLKKCPDKEYDEVYEALVASNESVAEEDEMTLSEYIASLDMTEEDFYRELEDNARQIVFEEMVMYYIARKEQIALTDPVFEEEVMNLAEENSLTSVEQYLRFMEQYGYTAYDVREQVWYGLVSDFLYENTKQITD